VIELFTALLVEVVCTANFLLAVAVAVAVVVVVVGVGVGAGTGEEEGEEGEEEGDCRIPPPSEGGHVTYGLVLVLI
tara:strand:+ start:1622 stop:1849 length:228 start_codon:yes stop_codon:yes gene_type:complete